LGLISILFFIQGYGAASCSLGPLLRWSFSDP
jgi:hypothetical protein